jgi:hypothetical protein
MAHRREREVAAAGVQWQKSAHSFCQQRWRVAPKPSLKGRSNGVPPGLGRSRRSPIFCGPGLASRRRLLHYFKR